MDFVDAMITTISVFAIVLLVLYLMSYFLGPKAHAFLRSNREEKIGLSKDKLFNANGYLVGDEDETGKINQNLVCGSISGSFWLRNTTWIYWQLQEI